MALSTLFLILRALALGLSFFGLCAAAKNAFKLNRFIAPYFCACSIICVLMLSGMLHVLKYGFYLLYIGGFASLAVCAALRLRQRRLSLRRSDVFLIAVGALLLAGIIWRLYPSYLHQTDDFAHWSVAARHLLETDAFPDASARSITFQSYPLGVTVFIYYVCRTLGNAEGLWMIAQNLLYIPLFMPILAHVRGNRKWTLPVLSALFLLLFKHTRPMESMYVDWLLSFFGFGAVAAILYYRDDSKRAILAALPGVIAVTLTKNSGFFFALIAACTLAITVSGQKNRRAAFASLLICMAASVGAYLLWSLHVKLTFPAALETKHAISLSAYAERFNSKDLSVMVLAFKKMVLRWLRPDFYQIQALLFIIIGYLTMYFTARRHPQMRAHLKPARQAFLLILAAYAVWYAMLYATYIFSMQPSEARGLAAYDRYNSTGLLLVEGLSLIVLVDFFARDELEPRVQPTVLCAVAIAAILLTSAWVKPGEYHYWFYPDLTQRRLERCDFRQTTFDFMQESEMPADGCYLVCAGNTSKDTFRDVYGQAFFDAKFELHSRDITIAGRITEEDGVDSYLYGTLDEKQYVEDPFPLIAADLESFDAIIVLEEDPVFDEKLAEVLADHAGDLPLIYP